MTGAWKRLRGCAVLELCAAAPEYCLNKLTEAGLRFWDVTPVDALTVRITVPWHSLRRVRHIAGRAQAEIVSEQLHPGLWALPRVIRRPCLLLGWALALLAVLVLPRYVWTVSVSGNERVPSAEILRAAAELGVCFGARNDSISSQNVKNHLLNTVDGLQWATVNCSGGRCEILVRERKKPPELLDRNLVTDVVAARSGTIVEQRVLAGEALTQVGDTVEAGQTLVSGTTDWVIDLQTAHAEAEIYALTWRELAAETPRSVLVRGEIAETARCRYLQIGRIRIKISGSSRICIPGCDKMVTRRQLTLPGGVTFPVVLIEETWTRAGTEAHTLSGDEAAALLRDYGRRVTEAAMTAGEICSARDSLTADGGVCRLDSVYACREMIAREQEVQLFGSEQGNGRTNSERGPD